ncbi:MAG: hypothetical protein VXY99_03110 [Pseudomonadota bacterium]|nr:hypothetical protein [Pseudomonadota bacterium]
MNTFITHVDALANFDFKPEQIFRAGNMLIGTKLINNKVYLVDTKGYGDELSEDQHNLLKFALECEQSIEVIARPTIEQRLAFALNASQEEQAKSEGWALLVRDGKIALAKDDTSGVFATNDAARDFVRDNAYRGIGLHLKVKDFLKLYAPDEHRNVFNKRAI